MINGLLITKEKWRRLLRRLATMTIFRGLTLVFTDGNPITGLGETITSSYLAVSYFLGIPVPAITMILAFTVLWMILHKTPFGRRTYAIGGNEKAAFISGIKVPRR